MLEFLLAVAIVVLVAWFVTAPVRNRPSAGGDEDSDRQAELADLDARREAKYRQIRDAEADRAAGKLTEEDFRRLEIRTTGDGAACGVCPVDDGWRGAPTPDERRAPPPVRWWPVFS
jgi:hypothetical protein